MAHTCTGGYSIKKEIVGILLAENSAISAEQIEEAGGGVVAVVLQVEDSRRLNLRSMLRDLAHSSGRGVHVAAVGLADDDGATAWQIVNLDYLRGLVDGMADMRRMLWLESSLRARG
ncbi:hypothetical protein OG401_14225 [Kitasatospora purpeofusca]|uniref:hypothetical protein n=1 Tax=Kitasatospora purpeofusca TaxID=67352 RepID=UPI0022580629|nr:hypothetical protein [Kitasatospora purpeofusca]MCX4685458.1 hypothetical protein [Kitasatospora purpeofusca]